LLSRPASWQKKESKYLSYARKLVVLSESFKNTLLKKYNFLRKEDLFVYPNVPDLSRLLNFPIDRQVFPVNNRFILFYFGGIGERRGIFTSFEAIRKLKNDIPEIHLLLIGPVDQHEQAKFNSFLHDAEISKHVTHYEWKDLSTLPSYVLASNICLSPLLRDEQHDSGVANKIFQYMLFERPILVSDCIPQLEIVETLSVAYPWEKMAGRPYWNVSILINVANSLICSTNRWILSKPVPYQD
jgi:glycosyltransferase involved in cell wall biosynthesis